MIEDREGFVWARPGVHLYYRILGREPEAGVDTAVVPNASWLATDA